MLSKENEFIQSLSEEEICELREAFNIFDVNSDGTINKDQLNLLLFSLKQYPTKEELEDILKAEGYDKLDQINFGQFLKIMGKRMNTKKVDEDIYFRNLFDSMDRNKNGMISIHEIRYIILHSNEDISEKELELLMNNVDSDNDGLISFEEFLSFMKNWKFKFAQILILTYLLFYLVYKYNIYFLLFIVYLLGFFGV